MKFNKNHLRLFIIPAIALLALSVLNKPEPQAVIDSSPKYVLPDVPKVEVVTQKVIPAEIQKELAPESTTPVTVQKGQKYSLIILDSPEPIPEQSLLRKLIPLALAQESNGKLVILDNATKKPLIIESRDVFSAKIDNQDLVTYLQEGSDYGIKVYNPLTKSKTRIANTADLQAYKDLVAINPNLFFIIQPTTGIVSLVDANGKTVKQLAQKIIPSFSEYTRSSAYLYSSLSPDKKLVATLDMVADANGLINLQIFSTDPKAPQPLYFQTRIKFTPSSRDNAELFSWSKDARYLSLGDNAHLIDVKNKKIISQKTEGFWESRVSPDGKSLALISLEGGELTIIDIATQKESSVTDQVTSAYWTSDSQLTFMIGYSAIFQTERDSLKLTRLDLPETYYYLDPPDPLSPELNIQTSEGLTNLSVVKEELL